MTRLVLRVRAALRRTGRGPGAVEYAVQIVLLLVVAAVVAAVLVSTAGRTDADARTTGWWPLVQGQAVNAVSLALLAAGAAVWYQVRYWQAKRLYLQRFGQHQQLTDPHLAKREPDPLVEMIVGQLLDVRPPRSSLVVSDDPDGRAELLDDVARRAAARRTGKGPLVPVTVDVSRADASSNVPALARDAFVRLFTSASADRARAERLLRGELRRHRVVVLLAGLHQVAEARSQFGRREVVTALCRSCVEEGLPFVAVVPAELVTPMSDVAVLRDGPADDEVQLAALAEELRRREITAADILGEIRRYAGGRLGLQRGQVALAADVVTMAVRAGVPLEDALRTAFAEPEHGLRLLRWMAERTGAGILAGHAVPVDRPVIGTLATLGLAGHHRQELALPSSVLAETDGAPDRLSLDTGLWTLARRGVVHVSDDDDRRVRFTRQEWFAFAGALALELRPELWSRLLKPGVSQATLDALTMAVGRAGPPEVRSPVALLRGLSGGHDRDVTLEMLTAVALGLQQHGRMDVRPEDVPVMARAWGVTSGHARVAFVGALDPGPESAQFLWTRALPGHDNPYRVRRAASRRLAAMGEAAWERLAPTWQALVADAEQADLGPSTRSLDPDSDWVRVARPFATLGWTLPSLVARLRQPERDAALDLLVRMTAAAAPPHGTGPVPDVGLEISLAEGYKLAAFVTAEDRHPDVGLVAQGVRLFRCARGWSSQVVLLQALALSGDPGPERLAEAGLAGEAPIDVQGVADGAGGHPFVREAAALTLRARGGRLPGGLVGEGRRDVWVDDVQSLQDGGLDLSGEAHRLLGLTTLLINLAERLTRGASDRPPDLDALERRSRALTVGSLPPCFIRSGHTATMFETECSCDLGLCGPGRRGTFGDRRISRSFSQRSEATSRLPALTPGQPFVTRAFAGVWRRPEIVDDSPT